MERFPNDIMFDITNDEINWLVSQSVIPSISYLGGAKPFVFTEQGVAIELDAEEMLAKLN